MRGRSWLCLLVMILPFVVWAQTAKPQRSQDAPPHADPLLVHGASPADPRSPAVPSLRRRLPVGPIGLPLLAQSAGSIFSGTVTGVVHRPPTADHPLPTVSITFHVENAIRGATPGQDFTLEQWLAAWTGGQTYRVGERVVLFLYAPSKLGLTSCVGGALGRFAVDPQGRILLTAQHLSAFREDPVLGGKARVRFRDFARAVRQASGEEEAP